MISMSASPSVAILLAAFTLPYGLLQLVVGPLADRVGKGKVLTGALLAYAVANGRLCPGDEPAHADPCCAHCRAAPAPG